MATTQLLMPAAPTAPTQGFRNNHSTNQVYQQQPYDYYNRNFTQKSSSSNNMNNNNNSDKNNSDNTTNTQNQHRQSHNRSMSSSGSPNNNYYRDAQLRTMPPPQRSSALTTPTSSASDLESAATTANSSRRASTTGTSAYPSPLINTLGFASASNSPSIQSPSSPRSAYHTRQIRPMYMPAVLRPNEFASKPTAFYCKDKNGLKDADELRASESRRSSIMSLAGLASLGQKLTRRSTDETLEAAVDQLNLELFPKVLGQPTKKHWKPDASSIACDEPSCPRTFSYLNRRHHCRKCGNIFCDSHSALFVPLDEDAKFNPRGSRSRACAHCHREYRAWRSRNNSLASSIASADGSLGSPAEPSMPPTPTTATGMAMPTAPLGVSPASSSGDSTDSVLAAGPRGPLQAPIVASVPRQWNWSTF